MLARDFIGWVRIVRPGSIHGPQQQFLLDMQEEMYGEGKGSLILKQVKGVLDGIEEKECARKIYEGNQLCNS